MGIIDNLFTQKLEQLPPELQRLAEKFLEGIAKAIGVPPEYISEEKVYKWVVNWTKAWTKPEYWKKLGIAAMIRARLMGEAVPLPTEDEMYKLGYELGLIIKEAM